VSENNLNKKYFTEADSPIPLIPTDLAWENMQEKLNAEEPEKRKRRLFFWIPPVGCATFVFLFLAGGMVIWQLYNKQTRRSIHQQRNISGSVQLTDTLLTQKQPAGNNNNNNDNANKTVISNDNQFRSVNTKTPERSIEQTSTQKPALTAAQETGTQQKPAKEHQQHAFKKKKRTAAFPVADLTTETDLIRDLPFATPQPVNGNMTISVTTNKALPGVLFPEQPSPDSNRNNKFIISAGLQWQAPVSFTGMDYYFKGSNGKDQPYQWCIPGVWLAAGKNKHQLIAMVLPFTSALLPAKRYETGYRPADSMMIYKRMVKVFGGQAGLHYNYQLTPHWWIGTGMEANWWSKGLVSVKPGVDSSGIKPYVYSIHSKEEKKLTPFQLSTVFETGYRLRAWEGILQVSRPWNATVKDLSPPVWLRLGIRYRLVQKKLGRP